MINGVRAGRKTRVPIDADIVKGSFLITVTRAFVEWVLRDQNVRVLGQWLNDSFIPDELFFSTLNFNPHLGAPGAYRGQYNSPRHIRAPRVHTC
jgi:beta-1,3-galactosyl-O-glycosyl-glycoprotein beta-1,6-N-acetylglucosaminyltransferase/N-acetyllactosaminide beta-1,6-N-acetylglucosaminyltransferase